MNKYVLSKLIGKEFVSSILRVTPAVVVSDAKQVSTMENGEPVFEFTVSKINYHANHCHNPLTQPRDVNTMFRGIRDYDFNVLYMQPVTKYIESRQTMLLMTQIVDTFEIIKESNLVTKCRFTIGNGYEESEYDATYLYRLYDKTIENYEIVVKNYLQYVLNKEDIYVTGIHKNKSYLIGLDYDKFKNDIQGIRDVRSSIKKVIGASIINDKIMIDDSESKINLIIDIDTNVLMFVVSAEFKYNLIEGMFEPWSTVIEEPTPVQSESDSSSDSHVDNGSDSDSGSEEPPLSDSDSTSDNTIPDTSESDSVSESEKEPEVTLPTESESDSTNAPETSESDSTSESIQTPDSSDGTSEENGVPSESDSTEIVTP